MSQPCLPVQVGQSQLTSTRHQASGEQGASARNRHQASGEQGGGDSTQVQLKTRVTTIWVRWCVVSLVSRTLGPALRLRQGIDMYVCLLCLSPPPRTFYPLPLGP